MPQTMAEASQQKKAADRFWEKNVFGKNVTIYSDPNDAVVPGGIYSDDGLPALRTSLGSRTVFSKICNAVDIGRRRRSVTQFPLPTCLTMIGQA